MKMTRIYSIWSNMKGRCHNSNALNFKLYGGRGIEVCWMWKNNFLAFWKWAQETGYTDELQIDRIDNDGNYEPTNCHWVTRSQNCRNKRGNRHITINGETKLLIEWSEQVGIHLTSMMKRIERHGVGAAALLPKGEYRQYWLAEQAEKGGE